MRPLLAMINTIILGFFKLVVNEMIWMIECVMYPSLVMVLMISCIPKDVLAYGSSNLKFK